jgi:hypothetical protein
MTAWLLCSFEGRADMQASLIYNRRFVMLLNLHVTRFDRSVMCKIVKQDKSITRTYGEDIRVLAELSVNRFIKDIKSCDAPEIKSTARTLFIRGEEKGKDKQPMTYTASSIPVADAICEDIVRLCAMVNGMSPENINVIRTDTLGSTYERQLNGTGDPDVEGVIIYTYEEVLK